MAASGIPRNNPARNPRLLHHTVDQVGISLADRRVLKKSFIRRIFSIAGIVQGSIVVSHMYNHIVVDRLQLLVNILTLQIHGIQKLIHPAGHLRLLGCCGIIDHRISDLI